MKTISTSHAVLCVFLGVAATILASSYLHEARAERNERQAERR